MKKTLLIIFLSGVASANAQTTTAHIGNGAVLTVTKNSLLSNIGGMEAFGTGKAEIFGNVMVVGIKPMDVFRTVNGNNQNFNLRYENINNWESSTYGQLYITGIGQDNITGLVNKEWISTKHGDYQQTGIPFYNKQFLSLNSELSSNFSNRRWTKREILKWNNSNVRFDGSVIPTGTINNNNTPGITIDLNQYTQLTDRTAYFVLGTLSGFNPESLNTVSGIPYTDLISVELNPTTVDFGQNGNKANIYREKYNTYISDSFENTPFAGTFGKYIYQFSNPFLTNLDLSLIGVDETLLGADAGDDNAISNIWGISVNPSNVIYNIENGTTSSYANAQIVTFDSGRLPVGNIEALIIKPLGTFKIKLRDNNSAQLNFDKLRRFNYAPRQSDVGYHVTAQKGNSGNSIKQLGVILLDENENQIGETYYAVAPHFITGHVTNPEENSVQAYSDFNSVINTYEEKPTGGIDTEFQSKYKLYINEANENNFIGKEIVMNISDGSSMKFEIRENAKLISVGTHTLSGGTGFYIRTGNGLQEIKQGQILPRLENSYGLYYGIPNDETLSAGTNPKKQKTVIAYSSRIEDYIVRFNPEWKNAEIQVYDMTGRLVLSEKNVNTSSDYVIKLNSINGIYVVRVKSDNAETVTTKISYNK
ncbi:MAG: T9SS type A sorting domain-containing protein [Bergeyella sp.]